MKVCCENGKAVSEMDDLDRLCCNHDDCLGPVEEYLYKALNCGADEILAKLKQLNEGEVN